KQFREVVRVQPDDKLSAELLKALTALAQEKKPADPPAVEKGTPLVLPRPDFHFPGEIGRTYLDSDKAQFPQPVQPPKGAPNVVLILLDDCGFGQFSTFG